MSDDRRQWPRELYADDSAMIRVELAARIVDESPTGIGLLLAKAGDPIFEVNQEITVEDAVGGPTRGRIVHVQKTPSNHWRLGVELEATSLPGVYKPIDGHPSDTERLVD